MAEPDAMRRRSFIKHSTAAAISAPMARGASRAIARAEAVAGCGDAVVWKPIVPPPAGIPALNGYTDTVPDIVGRLGSPIGLAIFSEGNHFPTLLGGEIIEPFRIWARMTQAEYTTLALDNIVVVTLPQPMIVGMVLGQGISFGNLTLEVGRASGFYPDIVMAGAAPLTQLRKASIVEAEARVFARNRGLALVVAAGNPLGVQRLEDLARTDIRVVLASATEPGARGQYLAALEALLGREAMASILARETVTFPGRLGIQHRDVLEAIARRYADVGIIFHHLSRYYAAAYPSVAAIVAVPEAEKFSSTIAMAATADPLRAQAAKAFLQFFLGVAREVYPRYGFAMMSEAEFGAAVPLG
jgi:ABC-type molybdate transport system substrate-binding protein